jgi:CMP-N-acetylneuraminic acid synthetase
MIQKVNVILPMRAGSQRVIDKNIKPMNGKPLYEYIIDTLLKCKHIDKIIINTDIQQVLEKYKDNNKFILQQRPEELKGNCDMNWVIKDVLSKTEGEYFIQLHVTSPLLSAETIDKSVETYFNNKQVNDILFSVNKIQMRFFDKNKKPINHKLSDPPTTQDLDVWYMEDCNLYVFSRSSFNKNTHRIGETPYLFPIHPKESVDIDSDGEFELAEMLIKAKTMAS